MSEELEEVAKDLNKEIKEEDDEESEIEEEPSKFTLREETDSSIFFQSSWVPESATEVEFSKEGVVTEQHLKDISNELGLIKLCWTEVPRVEYDDRLHYPPSYLSNSKKEKLLLWYAENFRQQFNFKYPYRRPLLIACDNECGVQKMVCTTIRPTITMFPEFQTWQGCASFVAEHLFYEDLESPTVLPDHINSPQTVLRRQAGHSFEYSTLLVSFLIASGYDAYVASGYATREICRKDQTRVECPFLRDEINKKEEQEIEEDAKYFLKKPTELKSMFLQKMDDREIEKSRKMQRDKELAELNAIKEFEKPPPDELWTWRLHSWVVILPSKEVLEPFFIESSTGVPKSVEDPDYHGIESMWNHQNYWVLVQFASKTETCKDISFDLNNPQNWERLLIGEPITFRQFPQELLEADTDEFNKACVQAEKHLDMPASWVDILHLPHSAYERRYPRAKKVLHYRKAMSEQFAPYSNSDGLVERVTRFEDYDCQQPLQIREKYAYRSDHMYFCEKTVAENSNVQKFARGREDALKEHLFYSLDVGIEVKFTLLFYHEARLDGLSELVMDPLYLSMKFENRTDFLYYVHVDFAERTNVDQPFRAINKITEKYRRNPTKEADKDVAVVEFCYLERKIYLKFHYESEHLTQTHREFRKPALTEKGAGLTFDPSLTSGYLTGPHTPHPKPLYLYQLELEYFKLEELVEKKVRERENELLVLLRLRAQELAYPRLIVTEFDIERNVEAKEAFKEKEGQKRETEERDMRMECDFVAPYYAKLGLKPGTKLDTRLAREVVNECLRDWKNLLVARANDLQQQFEQTCQDFYERNNWYEQNQSSITKEQEEEYFDYCKRNSYYLHILEVRLNRHKELAPKRFLAMDNYLKMDPRVSLVFFLGDKRKKSNI